MTATAIWTTIYTTLATLSLPLGDTTYVAASAADLPSEFLVTQVISSPPAQHADDIEQLRLYRVQVSYYNRTGLAAMPDIDGIMTAAGFMRGPLHELPYSQLTRHYGLALEYTYLSDSTAT